MHADVALRRIAESVAGPRPRWWRPRARKRWDAFVEFLATPDRMNHWSFPCDDGFLDEYRRITARCDAVAEGFAGHALTCTLDPHDTGLHVDPNGTEWGPR